MTERTKQNLTAGMQRDSLDAAKYQRFAAIARMDEYCDLARVFQETADDECMEHFARQAELAGMVFQTADNLRNAIASENAKADLFAWFAREAEQDGDLNAAATFDRISRDSKQSSCEFTTLLEQMGFHSSAEAVA